MITVMNRNSSNNDAVGMDEEMAMRVGVDIVGSIKDFSVRRAKDEIGMVKDVE